MPSFVYFCGNYHFLCTTHNMYILYIYNLFLGTSLEFLKKLCGQRLYHTPLISIGTMMIDIPIRAGPSSSGGVKQMGFW